MSDMNSDDEFPFVSEGTVAGLARELRYWQERADRLLHECAKLQEEVDQLRAENEALVKHVGG